MPEKDPPTTPQPKALTSYDFYRRIPTLILSALTAFAISYWNTQRTQDELRFRVMAVETKATTNAENIAKSASDLQDLRIKQAQEDKTQEFVLQELNKVRTEQEDIKNRLRR